MIVPDPKERLLELTSRMLDAGLNDREWTELAQLLQEDNEAQALFVQMTELHAMLDGEPVAAETLAEQSRPGNVVSLPGSQSVSSSLPTGAPSSVQGGLRKWLGAAAAIAALVSFAVWFAMYRAQPLDPGNPIAEVPTKTESPEVAAPPVKPRKHSDPKETYDRAIIATASTGSLQRPPTNFTSVISGEDGEISFNRDIRPILSDNCFSCHGPDSASRKADLRLDTKDGALAGDDPAIIPGDLAKSELVYRIGTDEADDLMPPADSHKVLTDQQKELLRRWVEQGADWEDHWAFIKPKDTLPDEISRETAIDYYIQRKLKARKLDQQPEASRRTLIRRVTLDLTGLPPTPEEVDNFLADESDNAYETLVDDLFSRPAYGEHRARYWLDAARYGDTHGLHLDNYREIWPYRDWVINSFNQNKPFDQFTVEQIAGDLLPDATQDQRIATGFNRCNVTTSEGGAIEEEFLVRYAVDRVATTATVWMGLTAGCAQCHDHKFDPLTQRDFYELFAYFNNTTQPGMDGNAKDSPPVIRVYETQQDEARAKELGSKIAVVKKKLTGIEEKNEAMFQEWLKTSASNDIGSAAWPGETLTHLEGNHTDEKPLDLGEAGRFSKDKPFSLSFRYKLPEMNDYGRAMLLRKVDNSKSRRGWEVYVDEQSMNVVAIESWPNHTLRTGATRRFKSGSQGLFTITYDGSGSSQGFTLYLNEKELTSRFVNEWFDTMEGDFLTDAPLLVGGKDEVSGHHPQVTEIRLFNRVLSTEEVNSLNDHSALAGLAKKEKRSDAELAKLRSFFLQTQADTYETELAALTTLEAELSRLNSHTPVTLVMQEKDAEPMANILNRGEYDQPGEEVKPGLPEFLPELDGEFSGNRLGLAQWLVHPDHPLTSRVIVNRIWQELFGVGLVKTSEDFGVQGEAPSHPELLDWLATEFVRSGWDMKALYRLIMMSDTYRQDSSATPELVKLDPENRLLARGPRFRLDAEIIRDQALAASGLLDTSVGGPSVKPYQPAGIWKAVGYTNSNTQTFFQDYGESAEHRRTLYSFWKRTAPPPNMAIFDAPNREDCVVRRERTNTPLQALVLMNDPQFVRASRYLALRAVREKEDSSERMDHMAMLLRSRPLSDEEETVVKNSFTQFRNAYESDLEAAKKLLVDEVNPTFSIETKDDTETVEVAAWTMVASQLMNLDEVLNKN